LYVLRSILPLATLGPLIQQQVGAPSACAQRGVFLSGAAWISVALWHEKKLNVLLRAIVDKCLRAEL
jgi:hypothetical protein